jgi:hypothetical protein
MKVSLSPTVFSAAPLEKSDGVDLVRIATAPPSTLRSPPCCNGTKPCALRSRKGVPPDPGRALDDLDDFKLAMDLFLTSKMIGSETLLREEDPKMEGRI